MSVFERYRMYKLKMKPLKYAFVNFSDKFLVFVVYIKGIDLVPTKVKVIQMMAPMTTQKHKKYHGIVISTLTELLEAFNRLLKKT